MRIARFAKGGDVAYGVVGETRTDGAAAGQPATRPGGLAVIAELRGHPFGPGKGGVQFTGDTYPLAEVRLLAPVLPSKVVAVARNYAGNGRETGDEPGPSSAGEPVLFLKPSTAVVGDGDQIAYPVKLTQRVDYRGELAVIIGRLCREVPAAQAAGVIFGYTCANDVTARDLQARDGQWTRAKGFDTFCPLGPWIETDADPADLELSTTVNGEARQRARTSQLLYDVPALVEYISTVMTLLPGDVLLTGTPAGVGPLEDGDEVSVTIENIGSLTNTVVGRD
ncbi:MAG TPA: fumarylacetoacetate hydrolase family protein [Streptosporangiaceae bacterium]|nr:fumarylacetoacetate hydrolase family protein [Streptosporangiaceae bacterium]